jgi:hypothetical protein
MRRSQNMPVIARRGKLKVLMYYNDHAPPHVHVDAGGDVQVVVSILDPKIRPGILSKKDRRDMIAWIQDNETALLANWARSEAGVVLEKLDF